MALNEEISADDSISLDDNEDILTDSLNNPGSFSELNQSIVSSTGTLILDKDYAYDSTTDSDFSNGIQINEKIVIDGKGHTISGSGEARVFYNKVSGTVIRNITFINAYRGFEGGAIESNAYMEIIDCNFYNNQGREAAAIGAFTTVYVANCTFINNTGTSTTVGIHGTVDNCTFINNTALIGGIHLYSGSVKNTKFINNTGTLYGGALTHNWDITIENCLFLNNKATGISSEGTGAIDFGYSSSRVTIINSTFINNTDTDNYNLYDTTTSENKFFINRNTNLINCTFENTNIRVDLHSTYYSPITVKFEGCTVTGGSIKNIDSYVVLSKNDFEDVYFENNAKINSQINVVVPEYAQQSGNTLILLKVVDDNGNSIYDSRILDFINLTVDNEEVPLDDYIEIDGNWYYTTSRNLAEGNYNVTINLKNQDEFNKLFPQATLSNGAIEVGDFNNFGSLDSKIKTAQGNIIALTEDYTFDITNESDYINGIVIDKDNIIIDGNGHTINAATVARIFKITGQNVTLRNINFVNGFGDKGGAVYSLSDVTIDHCTFTNNKAFDGGAIYIANANIIDSTFSNNIASEHGGAAYLINANITNSTFTQNRANDNGGAVYIKNKGNIKDSKFNENTAKTGGAIYFENEAKIENTSFTSNSANSAGAIYVTNAATVENAKFISNDANTAGAAFFNGEMNVKNSEFIENTAGKAGAIYVLGDGNIDGSTFTSNYAERGLAIMNAGLLNIENTKFEDQTDGNYDNEIILFLNGEVTLTNVTPKELNPLFSVDLAINGIYGGAYYLDNILIEIMAFNENTILNHGVVRISLDNANYTCDVIDGAATMQMPILEVGTYLITFAYDGGDKYEKPVREIEFSIYPQYTRIMPDFDIYNVGEGEIFICSLSTYDDKRFVGEEITFNIDGIINVTSITNNDGVAVLLMTPSLVKLIGYGEKEIYMSFKGNKNLYESDYTTWINVTKEGGNPQPGTDYVNTNGEYSTVITDDSGRPLVGQTVYLLVGGTTITAVTDGNGVATFNIPADILSQLQTGTAQISISYNSNGYAHVIDKNITLKHNTQIVANAASYVINYGGKYSVTLKDANGKVLAGKQVTFTLNGKNIGSAVTNANGVATFKLTARMLKTAKAGSKNLAIRFNGDTSCNPSSKTVKLTIKKEKTKIVAKKKTFKRATKTKKYTITLKNSKGKAVKKVKVFIKVGKKTYKAKTNSKGKATFKITKLTNTGKYTAKITFKANAYYLKATKKVKITVK